MLGAISFILKNWKAVIAIASCIACFGAGFWVSGKIWSIKYKELENQFNGCQTSWNWCMAANEENQSTISKLKKELQLKNKQCEQRVNYYKELLQQFQQIDNLTGGINEEGTVDCPDDICVYLNRMWR